MHALSMAMHDRRFNTTGGSENGDWSKEPVINVTYNPLYLQRVLSNKSEEHIAVFDRTVHICVQTCLYLLVNFIFKR